MKKFVSLLLVFSILALSIPLTAKERKGADLLIQKTDGTQVRGELIAVKENSLLLMERESGADVTVDVEDIRVIKILKKSKISTGSIVGAGFGAALIALGLIINEGDLGAPGIYAVCLAIPVGIGALFGIAAGADKTIQFEGKSNSEIQKILEKLRKKARVRNSQ